MNSCLLGIPILIAIMNSGLLFLFRFSAILFRESWNDKIHASIKLLIRYKTNVYLEDQQHRNQIPLLSE